MIDRSRYPRAWVKTIPYDPDLPIRGRYVSLRLEVKAGSGFEVTEEEKKEYPPSVQPQIRRFYRRADLQARNGEVVAILNQDGQTSVRLTPEREDIVVVDEPVAYFIPEHVQDPSRRPTGEQLWVEVTLPPKGPPRPIQLGIKRDGTISPMGLR
jgi:uncharacterized membrane-anchored protein